MRENYGDCAVGYVQLKRENGICYLHARITSEHKVHAKAYNISVEINELNKAIIKAECLDCIASLGNMLKLVVLSIINNNNYCYKIN